MFKKAVKQEAKLRLAIAGPSGSGKTYTGLALATTLAAGKPVAVVDTEHGSASKYADIFDFDVAEMHAPFHPDKFVQAITQAAEAGYGVIVLDSLTHAWSGTGGMLDIVDEIAKRMKSPNTFAAWKDATPIQNRLVDAIVGANIHVVATMRSKQEYLQDRDEKTGRVAVRKVGMAPQQRDGFEYEFDVFLDMDIENNAIVAKTRCPELTGRVFAKPGADLATILANWLHGSKPQSATGPVKVQATQPATTNGNGNGKPAQAEQHDNPFDDKLPAPELISKAQLRKLHAVGTDLYGEAWDTKRPELVRYVTKDGRHSSSELTVEEAKALIDGMERKLAAKRKQERAEAEAVTVEGTAEVQP